MTDTDGDVAIVGGGVAGLTAGIFTARADLDTVVVDHGESILARNARLENVPGFPAGVDARLFLEMALDGAERAGCRFREGCVVNVRQRTEDAEYGGADAADTEEGFAIRIESSGGEGTLTARYVVAASWSDPSYLEDLDVGFVDRGSKTFVDADEGGDTGVDGLYAAGRLAERHHQAIVAAGDGAATALTLLEESDVPFYHDWVVPEGYFTGRDRDVPPGCEEIGEEERRRRERESRTVMRGYFAEPHPGEPTQHPSVDGE